MRAKYPKLEQQLLACEADEEFAQEQYNMGGKPAVHVRWGDGDEARRCQYVYDLFGGRERVFTSIRGPDGERWWDGYAGEPVILLSDFAGDMAWWELMGLLDRYPFRLRTQDTPEGCKWRLATQIFITSGVHPSRWYPDENPRSLERRCTTVTRIDDP